MCTQSGSAADTHHIHTHIRCTRCVPRMSHFDKLMRKICLAEVSRSLHATQMQMAQKQPIETGTVGVTTAAKLVFERERPRPAISISHSEFGFVFIALNMIIYMKFQITHLNKFFVIIILAFPRRATYAISPRFPFRSVNFGRIFRSPFFVSFIWPPPPPTQPPRENNNIIIIVIAVTYR